MHYSVELYHVLYIVSLDSILHETGSLYLHRIFRHGNKIKLGFKILLLPICNPRFVQGSSKSCFRNADNLLHAWVHSVVWHIFGFAYEWSLSTLHPNSSRPAGTRSSQTVNHIYPETPFSSYLVYPLAEKKGLGWYIQGGSGSLGS